MKTTETAASTAAASSSAVQTSAQQPAEVLHQEPSTGGSYTRNPETGDLVRADQAPASPVQE
ncbi:hypothetical protein LK540_17285 [Massilia sp. IC2-278]|uniref:hypothetical protein n=1 Tax=Massilia sp. IC2-278 TaxID=2887200 RepID=UPI001E59A78B|nr:hypothetical protein [Massilia sp. IC2-278]MCC2962183.1 hypothetical protein [Massilia sp. IC2-278]